MGTMRWSWFLLVMGVLGMGCGDIGKRILYSVVAMCDTDEDCEDGLECNEEEHICREKKPDEPGNSSSSSGNSNTSVESSSGPTSSSSVGTSTSGVPASSSGSSGSGGSTSGTVTSTSLVPSTSTSGGTQTSTSAPTSSSTSGGTSTERPLNYFMGAGGVVAVPGGRSANLIIGQPLGVPMSTSGYTVEPGLAPQTLSPASGR